jgi:predicted CXXCH cytochrome family protein
MMRKDIIWVAMVMSVLLAGGCDRPEPPPVAPPRPTIEEQKAPATKGESAPESGKVPAETAPTTPTVPAEAVKPLPTAPARPPAAKPAPVEVVDQAPVEGPKSPPVEVATVILAVAENMAAEKHSTNANQPGTVSYDASFGRVTFNHQKHAQNNSCASCHNAGPATKIPLGKDKAHQLCKGCHQQKSAGPSQCNGCHVKG